MGQPPTPLQPINETANSEPVSSKKRTIATILWLFLGWFGAHNFYAGHKTPAFIELAVGLLYMLGTISALASTNVVEVVSLSSQLRSIATIYGIFLVVECVFIWTRKYWWATDGNGAPLQ